MNKIFLIVLVCLALQGCATLEMGAEFLQLSADRICERQDEIRLAAIVGLESEKSGIRDASSFMLKALEACPPLVDSDAG